jgi:hypothetical protein
MAFNLNKRSTFALTLALAVTLAALGVLLTPAPSAEAFPADCGPGEVEYRTTSTCCCVGSKLRQKRTCQWNGQWGSWSDADCNGGGCTPHGACA